MLKSTKNPLSKEQFTHLREARALIKEQFEADFSLRSDQVVQDLYEFALRSETNELFRLFTDLNDISDTPVGEPLNEEQFILLREARSLVDGEFDDKLHLAGAQVMAELYAKALASKAEDLFDIHRYLNSREDLHEPATTEQSGTYFRKVREAKRIAEVQLGEDVTLAPLTALDTLAELAMRSEDALLVEAVNWLQSWQPDDLTPTELLFHELSAPDFERLREAKHDIYTEFGETLSLHADSTLDDLYEFALRSKETVLFELFCDLLDPQMTPRAAASRPSHWFSRDQYTLLRAAREAILAEFDDRLDITATDVYVTLYGYALRAEEEDLFDLCKELHNLGDPAPATLVLPSKEEFRMLRQAQTLILDEFGEALELHAEAVRDELYRYAVNSEVDDLFDIHTELEAISAAEETTDRATRLSKDEFVSLRQARQLIRAEFGEHLALEDAEVLDRLYEFALQSEGETLFDLHAELNAGAIAASEEAVRVREAVVEDTGPDNEPEPLPTPVAEVADTQADAENHSEEEPSGLKRVFGLWRGAPKAEMLEATPQTDQPVASDAEEEAAVAEAAALEAEEAEREAAETEETAETASNPHMSFPDLLVRAIDQAPKGNADDPVAEETSAQNKKRRGKPQRRSTTPVKVKEVELDADAAASPDTSTPETTTRWQGAERTATDPTNLAAAANDSEIQMVPEGWYISTLDDRLRVRLSTKLSVGEDGELLVAAPLGTQICAVIEMTANAPVVIVQNGSLLVNDTLVDHRQALASGDRIAVAGTELQVEYQTNPKPGDTALSAG